MLASARSFVSVLYNVGYFAIGGCTISIYPSRTAIGARHIPFSRPVEHVRGQSAKLHIFHTPDHRILPSGLASVCSYPLHRPIMSLSISTFCCTVKSQSTNVTDRQTDGRTNVMQVGDRESHFVEGTDTSSSPTRPPVPSHFLDHPARQPARPIPHLLGVGWRGGRAGSLAG